MQSTNYVVATKSAKGLKLLGIPDKRQHSFAYGNYIHT